MIIIKQNATFPRFTLQVTGCESVTEESPEKGSEEEEVNSKCVVEVAEILNLKD